MRCRPEECLEAVTEVAVAEGKRAYHAEFEEGGASAADAFEIEDASASVAYKAPYTAQNLDQEAFPPQAYKDTIKTC